MSEPTDFAKFQRFFHDYGVDLKPGEWWGHYTLTLEKGAIGLSTHSDDCKVTLTFAHDGSFVDILVTCSTCEIARET
jgi:hypothetical protein